MFKKLNQDIKNIQNCLIEWRRDFHRFPEVAFQEVRTSSVIRKFMENLNIPVTACAKTGLRGILKGQTGGKTVALRADMDALPLQEESDKSYKSQNPDACHACGHDGHMAILMGVIQLLAGRKDQFQGDVVFLFQPSEERIPGGAKMMIEEGALDGVDAVFGLHLWQPLKTGAVGVVKGPMMAQPDVFSIKVRGKGGHGSMPHQTIDPIYVSSQLVVNVQSIISRSLDPLKPGVVSFGTIHGGTIDNIIPGEVSLTGTVRTFEPEIKSMIRNNLEQIVEQTCKAFGAEAELEYTNGYPPVINNPEMVDLVTSVAKKTLGKDCLISIDPVMGGEDFSYFLQRVPGAFFFLGIGDGQEHPHHHPCFDIDEKALPQGVLLMTTLALEYLLDYSG